MRINLMKSENRSRKLNTACYTGNNDQNELTFFFTRVSSLKLISLDFVGDDDTVCLKKVVIFHEGPRFQNNSRSRTYIYMCIIDERYV